MPLTGKRQFRFIYSGASDSFTNMAMDEAVMTGLQSGVSLPLLRIYKWDPPTITIGYFQKAEDIDFDQCSADGVGVVRRMTGGRAVLHWEELTYSILFSREDFAPFHKKEIFTFIARCLVDSLLLLGIRSSIAEKSRGNLKSADCFAAPAQFEVESADQEKLIGSAQTIKGDVVLQHGAIPYSGRYCDIAKYLRHDTDSAKSASYLSRIAGKRVDDKELLHALRKGFSRHLPLVEGTFTREERALTRKLVREKYSKDAWMFRR
jgi:lipoate-protein ligase A